MPKTVLVTGASSGLGAEYARRLAARGADVVLVGRDREALDAVAAEIRERYPVQAETLVADLTKPRQRAKVEARLTDPERPIEVLVNNAGFGLPLAFERNDIEDEARHLELHVEVPMRLMHAALGPMLSRGHGRIINVASVAAYTPRSTYGAVKRWVVEFSRWANAAYAPSGVTVTAVCPGFTHTNFHERMGLAPGREGVADWLWLDADVVVEQSLRDAARGRAVSIPSLKWKLITAAARLLPASVSASAGRRGR
ncbi:SDR family oxidoreductase [Microbacterium schleiferi]|uniref:SDR family NAD(P)-dependent oxidoreductase n=1 Tax=Microbacterium schleiferi TaxID=69362 RepID=UPI00311F9500